MFKIKFNISWTYLIFKTRILLAVIVLKCLFTGGSCQSLQAAPSSPVLVTLSNPKLEFSGVFNKYRFSNPNVNLEPRNAESHSHPTRLKTEAIINPVHIPISRLNHDGQRVETISAIVNNPSTAEPNIKDQNVKIESSIELKAESSVFPTVGVIGFKYQESDANWKPEKALLDMTEAFIKDDVQEYLYRKHKEKLDSEVVTIEKSKELIPGPDLSNFIPQSTREPDYDDEADKKNFGNIWGTNYPQVVAVSPPQSTSSRPVDPRFTAIWTTTTTTKRPIDPQFAGIWETTTSTRPPIDPQYAGLWETTTSAKPTIDPQYAGLWETKYVSKNQQQNLDQINENSKQKIAYDSYKHKASHGEFVDDSSQPKIKYFKDGSSTGKTKKHHHVGKYGHTDVEPYSASSTKGKAGLVTQQSFRHKNEKPYHEPQESYVDQYNDKKSTEEVYREHKPTYETPIETHNKAYAYRGHGPTHYTPTDKHNEHVSYTEHKSSYHTPTENHNKPQGYTNHESAYHTQRENRNKYHDYAEYKPTYQTPTEYHNKHHGYVDHAPTYQSTIENHHEHRDSAEQGPTYQSPTENHSEDYDEVQENERKQTDGVSSWPVKEDEDSPRIEGGGASWETTPEKIQNEFLQQVQSIKENNGNSWQATGPGSVFYNFPNSGASNEQGFANSPVPVIPLSPIPHGAGPNVYYWPPTQVNFFGYKDPGTQYHWQPIYPVHSKNNGDPYSVYDHSTESVPSPHLEASTTYSEDHNEESGENERQPEETLEKNISTRNNDEDVNGDEKSEASSFTGSEELKTAGKENSEEKENDENVETESEEETRGENYQEENEKQEEESPENNDNTDPYYDEKFGTDAAFKPPPPDPDEERVRSFVSDHEFPRKVPTRLGYQGGGLWARPHSDSGIQLGFVPTQIYTQVRRQNTVRHLPREEAYAAASTPEEIINAPRLREVISHKKIQEVYEEEGYEDSGYDHGGYNKHGEHSQDHEKNLGDDSQHYDEPVRVPSQAEAEREHLQHIKNVDSIDDTQGAAQRQVVQRIEEKPKIQGQWKQQKVVTNEKSMMFTDDIGRGGILTEKLPPKMEGTVGQYVNLNGKRVPIVRELNDIPQSLVQHSAGTSFQRVSQPPVSIYDQSASIEGSLFGYSGEDFRSTEDKSKRGSLERIPLLSTDNAPLLHTDHSGGSSLESEIKESSDEVSSELPRNAGTYHHGGVSSKPEKLQKTSGTKLIPILHSDFSYVTPVLQRNKYTEDKHVRGSVGLVDSVNDESIKHYTRAQEAEISPSKTSILDNSKHSVVNEPDNSNIRGDIPTNHKMDTSEKEIVKNGNADSRDEHLLYIIYKGKPKQNGTIKSVHSESLKNYEENLQSKHLTDRNAEDELLSLTSSLSKLQPKAKHTKNKVHVVRRSNRKYKLIPRSNVTRSNDEESKSEASHEDASNWKINRNEHKMNTRHPFLPIDGGTEKIVLPLPPPRRTTPDPEEETYTRAPQRTSLREYTTKRHQQTTTTEPVPSTTTKPVHMENAPDGLLSKIRSNVYLAAVYNQTIEDLKEAYQQKSEDMSSSSTVKQVEELTAAHYAEPRNEKQYKAVSSSQQERISNLARQLNNPTDNPDTVSTKLIENRNKERIRRNTDFLSLGAQKLDNKMVVDEIKYPFYKRPPMGHLAKYSPLRYATNPKNIPRKTNGGMEFYESRDRMVYCEEPTPPKDINPKRGKDGEWNKNPTPKVPRLIGLGDKILCMKIKYFDEDPLDNPFFKEEDVNIPEVFSSGPSVKFEDQLGLYADILSHIKDDKNKNKHSDVFVTADQSLRQVTSSSTASVKKHNNKKIYDKRTKSQLKESDKKKNAGYVVAKEQNIPSDSHKSNIDNTGNLQSLNLLTTPRSVPNANIDIKPTENENLKRPKEGQTVTSPVKYDIMKIITPTSKYNFPDISTHRPILERRPAVSSMPTFFSYKNPLPNHLVPPALLYGNLYQTLNRRPNQRHVIYLQPVPVKVPIKLPRSIFDFSSYGKYDFRPYLMPQARITDLQTSPASLSEITSDHVNINPKSNVGTIEYIISIEPKISENTQDNNQKVNTNKKRDIHVDVLNSKWWFPATYDNRRGEPKYFTYRTKRDAVDKNNEFMRGKDSIELLNSLLKNHKIPEPDVGRTEDRHSYDRKNVNNTLHSEEDLSKGRKLINRILGGGFVSRHNPAYSSKYSKIDPLLQNEDTAGGNSTKNSRRDVSNNTTGVSLNRPKVRFPKLAVGTRLIAKQEVIRPPKQQVPETTPPRIITTTTTTTTTETPITTTRMYKPRRVVKKDFSKGKIVDAFAVLKSQRESAGTERVADEDGVTELVQLARPESSTSAIKPRRLQQVEHRRVTKEEIFKKTYIPHYGTEETKTTTHRVDTYDVLRDHPDLSGPISRATRDYEEDDLAPMGDEILYNETLMYVVNPKTGEGYWESVPYDGTRKPERLESQKGEEKLDKVKKTRRTNSRKRNRNLQPEEVTEYSNEKKGVRIKDGSTFRKRNDEAEITTTNDEKETDFTEAPTTTEGVSHNRRRNRPRHTSRRLKNKVYVMSNLMQQVPPSVPAIAEAPDVAIEIEDSDTTPQRIAKPETKIIVEPDKRKYFYVVDK